MPQPTGQGDSQGRPPGPHSKRGVHALIAVIMAVSLLFVATCDRSGYRRVCRNTGQELLIIQQQFAGLPLWSTRKGPYETPLSKCLAPHPTAEHKWACPPVHVTPRLIASWSSVEIHCPEEHKDWFRVFLRKVILNPETPLARRYGSTISSALAGGGPINWDAWRQRGAQVGIAEAGKPPPAPPEE
jgi:hypothetical protein